MRLKYLVFSLILISAPNYVWAGDSLLNAGFQDVEKNWYAHLSGKNANLNLMSDEGLSAFQKMRDLGVVNKSQNSGWVVFHESGDKVFSVFTPVKKTNQFGGVIQQVEVSNKGEVARFAFKIPETPQESRISLGDDAGFAKGPSVRIERSWSTPTGVIAIEQAFVAREIDGRLYRSQEMYHWKKGKEYIGISRWSNTLAIVTPGSHLTELKFEKFNGEIIGFQLSADASRLTFQTSAGEEYGYKLDLSNRMLTATKTSFSKISLKDFLVESKVFKGRVEAAAGESAHGMTVETPVAK